MHRDEVLKIHFAFQAILSDPSTPIVKIPSLEMDAGRPVF